MKLSLFVKCKKKHICIKADKKNLGDIKDTMYIFLLFYTIAAVETKGRKEKKKPHSGESDTKSYPKSKLQRIKNNKGSFTDNEFEKKPSDQWELFISGKSNQVVTRKGIVYRGRLSHI